jgi:hypothetical protein
LTFITVCKSFQPLTFLGEFFAFLPTDPNSALNFAFYDTHIEFLQKPFLRVLLALAFYDTHIEFLQKTILALFANFEVEFGQNGSKNRKTYFINVC